MQPLIGCSNALVKPLGLFTAILAIDDIAAKVKIHVVDFQKLHLTVGHSYIYFLFLISKKV